MSIKGAKIIASDMLDGTIKLMNDGHRFVPISQVLKLLRMIEQQLNEQE